MADYYKVRPSTLFYIKDEYTAYCFDEACAIIAMRIKGKETPSFTKKIKSLNEYYKSLGLSNI